LEDRALGEYSKLKWAVIYLLVILLVGTVGYNLLEPEIGYFDAFYMTVITISTVGFSEITGLTPASRPLTIVLIFMGIGLISFIFVAGVQLIIEGEIRRILGRRKLDKRIAALSDHIIICGFGQVGEVVANQMRRYGKKYVVVEKDSEKREALERLGHLYIIGDATQDAVLEQAGVTSAAGLLAVTHPDPNNVFIVLTAKELNPDIAIHSRAYEDEAEKRLVRAGADRVIYPDRIGGFRMAMSFIRPGFVNFIDVLARDYEQGEISVDEVTVGGNCRLIGKNLMDANLRQKYNLIVIAVGRTDGTVNFNPGRDTVIHEGDTLIVIGPSLDLRAFGKEFDALEMRG
jgi:voltage-gated potassium channel